MQRPNAESFILPSGVTAHSGLLFICLLISSARVGATEDPAGCSLANGGSGNTSQGGIGFNRAQAHVGDSVPVFPALGMSVYACRAINATGSVYIATGRLTNFLVNVTLNPGALSSCPAGALCQPGPYNVLITPALVGAGVNSPNGAVPGATKMVRAVQNGFGTVLTGAVNEHLSDFHTASIQIVTPCLQVVEQCAYAAGTNCFPAGGPIQFTGYVTNCGNIQLTNVTVLDSRTASLTVLSNGSPVSPFGGPYSLAPSGMLTYSGSFTPTAQETSAGTAANTVTVRGTDVTAIGGPNASVTNQMTASCAICNANPMLSAPAYAGNNPFQFIVTGQMGSNYVVQASTNLATSNWLSLRTNAAPFTFVESTAVFYPARFYRAMLLP